MSILSGDLHTLSYEAYVYLYPLVTMDLTRHQLINVPAGTKPAYGPPNQFHHVRSFPPAAFRVVVRPNFDTLYSSAWLDLTSGPIRLTAPDTDDRYYMLPLLDMWTDVFANPGKRTTGTGAQDFIIAGPGDTGELPAGVQVITAPTPWVWVIGRTQTNGAADYDAVNAVQDGFTITPLTPPAGEFTIDRDFETAEPLAVVNAMSAVDFFTHAAAALALHPPHSTDFSVLARIANLGVVPGEPFDPDRFTGDELAQVEAGAAAARDALIAARATLSSPVDGWISLTETIGVYGNDYFKRAAITLMGLGANPPEDAIYPLLIADADGEPLTGEQDYVVHFDADKLPPAFAFWSITMYDREGYQAANELDRFAIGDRDPLQYNTDGSLDIYIRHTNPGPDRQSNWLPAPLGPLGITMRLYAPKAEAVTGTWTAPPVRKA